MARKSSSSPIFRLHRLGAALAACFASTIVLALPTGGQVAAGTAVISQTGNTLTVTNTSGAIINWQGFSIGSNETARFIQPSAVSSVLNRVVTSNPSVLLGQLQSNGQVFLINPAGILVGAGARIDVAGFVASSLQLSDADFLAKRFLFQNAPGAGLVRNEGTIATPTGGSVYLIAPKVENAGLITTPKGETLLAAGQTVEIGDTATPGVRVEITGSDSAVTNLGTVVAESGRIGLVGALVKNSGNLSAASAISEGGRVFLRATSNVEQTATGQISAHGNNGGNITLQSGDTTLVDGQIDATGLTGKGGSVEILGDKVGLIGNANVNASGATGGGTILVGGDYQGKNAAVPNARFTFLGQNAALKADATQNGDGGKVIVWADDTTRAFGQISARGGAEGGNGGLVETSGKTYLDVGALAVDTRAPAGKAGTWLLDPDNLNIMNSADSCPGCYNSSSYAPNTIFTGGTGTVAVNWSTIASNLNNGSVLLSTLGSGGTGNISIYGGTYNYTSANDLWFVANQGISGSGVIMNNGGTGHLKFIAGWSGTSLPADPWNLSSYSVTNPYGVSFSGSTITTKGSIYIKAGGDVTVQTMYPSGNANAFLHADGNLTIETGGNLSVGNAPMDSTPSSAEISSGGSMDITLSGNASNISVLSSGMYGGGPARIRAGGDQNINFSTPGTHSLTLTGGGTSTPAGASAVIEAGGNQSISGDTLDIALTGGSSSATGQNVYDGPYGTGTLLCTGCATANRAEIRSQGNQTIQANTLTLQGGTYGIANSAEISAQGTQTITTTGNVLLSGGSSGGAYLAGTGTRGLLGNDAGLHSETGQYLNIGGDLTLTGGSAQSSGVFGAFVTAPNQNIAVGGALTLQGGSSTAPATGMGMASGAVIGYDNTLNSTISVAGNLTLQAGSGSEGSAYIGTPNSSANITLVASNISLTGTTASRAAIGSLNGSSSGNLALVANGSVSAINLGERSELLAGNSGTIILASTGAPDGPSINQSATSTRLTTARLVANTSGSINLNGADNQAQTVSLIAGSGDITYTSNASFTHVAKATTAASGTTVTLQTNASAVTDQSLGLGTIVGDTVTVSARNAILDDNGDGVANITANSINLTTTQGGNPSGIAISADIVSGGAVNASAPAASAPGGIRIHSLGPSVPSSLNLSDATGSIFFAHEGSLVTNSNYILSASSGSVILAATGDLTFSGGSITAPGGARLNAGNTLNVSSALSNNGSLYLGAGASVDISGSVSSSTGDLLVTTPTLAVNSGASLQSNNIALLTSTLTVNGSVQANNNLAFSADQMALNGGSLNAASGDLKGEIAGDLKMNGGSLSAGNNVYLNLSGGTSTLYLNERSGQPKASISSGSLGTIELDFPGRSEGGVVIDGVPSFATVSGSSGFYNGSTPAILGTGLLVSYGTQSNGMFLSDILSTTSSLDASYTGTGASTPTTSQMPTDTFADNGGATGGTNGTAAGTGSTSGTGSSSDEFGGGSATGSGNNQNGNGDDKKSKDNRRSNRTCR